MVCPSTGQTVGLLSPYVDGKVMSIFLQQFSQQLPADVQAVLVWDQAGFHKSKELCVPENVTIIELPAYSPELNPVETLWEYLRGHHWPNRAYKDYEHLRLAACQAWQATCLDVSLIRSICHCNYVERKNLL